MCGSVADTDPIDPRVGFANGDSSEPGPPGIRPAGLEAGAKRLTGTVEEHGDDVETADLPNGSAATGTDNGGETA